MGPRFTLFGWIFHSTVMKNFVGGGYTWGLFLSCWIELLRKLCNGGMVFFF